MTTCFEKSCSIPFNVRVCRERFIINLCVYFFPFGFEGEIWDLIHLVPDHCLFTLHDILSSSIFPNLISQ